MEENGRPPDGEELAALREQLAETRAGAERLRHDVDAAGSRADAAVAEAAALRGELQASDERAAAAASEAEALRAQLAEAAGRASAAADRYRDLVLRTQPELPPELIAGDEVDAVDASVEAARAVVGRVRTHIESQAQAARVPAGAPPRGVPDLSALTPEQKIRHGLASRSQP